VCAALNHSAAVQMQHQVRIRRKVKIVRDEKGRAFARQPLKSFYHRPCILIVKASGGFVHYENRRFANRSAGNRDALALAARKFYATLADS